MSALLKEYESIALNHSSDTAVRHYVETELKKSMALTVNMWFRSTVIGEDNYSETDNVTPFISEEQDQRFMQGELQLEGEKLKAWLDTLERRDNLTKPTLSQTVTDKVRIALLQLIKQSSEENIYVSSKGKPLDLFLMGEPVLNNKCVSFISRMLHHVPAAWKCREVLIENLFTFARLMAGDEYEELTPRKLEVLWIKKLLKSLEHMRSFGNIDHPAVLSIFADLSKKYGFKYCLKNKALVNQMKHWLAKEDERHSAREANYSDDRLSLEQLIEDQSRNKSLKSITRISTLDTTVRSSTDYNSGMSSSKVSYDVVQDTESYTFTDQNVIVSSRPNQEKIVTESESSEAHRGLATQRIYQFGNLCSGQNQNGNPCSDPNQFGNPCSGSNQFGNPCSGSNQFGIPCSDSNQIGDPCSDSNQIGNPCSGLIQIGYPCSGPTPNRNPCSDPNLHGKSLSCPQNLQENRADLENVDEQVNCSTVDVDVNQNINCPGEPNIRILTPKVNRFGKAWNDPLKLKLLQQYIIYCPDPMLSNVKIGWQRLHIDQCFHLREYTVNHKGIDQRWKMFTTSTSMGTVMTRFV